MVHLRSVQGYNMVHLRSVQGYNTVHLRSVQGYNTVHLRSVQGTSILTSDTSHNSNPDLRPYKTHAANFLIP